MPIERQSFLTILEDSFSAYYDIVPQEHPTLPLVFRGDYLKRDERYWLMKSIPIWASETGEFAYIFSAEQFSPELAKACIDFALEDGLPRVKPHKEHQCTNIKVVFLADAADDEVRKAVKKLSFTKSYRFGLWGFTNLLAGFVDMETQKTVTNAAGHELAPFFKKLFDLRA